MKQDLKHIDFPLIYQDIRQSLPSEDVKALFDQQGFVSSKQELKERQDKLKEAIDVVMTYPSIPRGALHRLWEAFTYAEKGGTLSTEELVQVLDNLQTHRRLKAFYDKGEDFDLNYPYLSMHFDLLVPDKDLETFLQGVFDAKGEIKDSASKELAQIRRSIDKTQRDLQEKMSQLISSDTLANYLQEQLVTIKNNRYVVPVKSQHKSRVPGMVHARSATGSTIYIEPIALVELNNKLSEQMIQEKEEIHRILTQCSHRLANNVDQIRLNEEQVHHLILQFSLAQYHVDKGMHLAKCSSMVRIYQGRHPLIDPKTLVPLELIFGDKERILVITGPNTGGKTVVLKTLGLFSALHAYGLGIPAGEGSELPLFDRIFVDIGDEQDIAQSLSTFSSHMSHIKMILEEATEDSLVLLDEIGAGTDPSEGSALARSILSLLKERGSMVLTTSHYSDVKEFALSHPGYENASVTFDLENLEPTYHLLMGIPGNSNAIEIAKRLGMGEEVIKRSYAFMEASAKKLEVAISRMEETRRRNEQLLEQSQSNLEEAKKKHERYEKALQGLQNREESIIQKAKEQAADLYKKQQEEVKQILKELRQMKAQGVDHQKAEQLGQLFYEKSRQDQEVGTKEAKPLKKTPKKIKSGQQIYVPKLGQDAIALEDSRQGRFMAQVGILKIQLKVNEVEIKSQQKQDKHYEQMAQSFTPQYAEKTLDLRGKNKDDTLVLLDQFIHDAWFGKLPWVEIIHGKGTGVLRHFVHDCLKKHKNVESFRLGQPSEGGDGVTIAKIKP